MKKLDPRIKDRKYIFDCFNADEAKKYIGKLCYMTDYFERFEDVDSTAKCTLRKIDEDGFFTDGEDDFRFTYCLPAELVAPKEKRYRPYTLREFEDKFHIGLPIRFRRKGEVGCERLNTERGYRHEQYNGQTVTYIFKQLPISIWEEEEDTLFKNCLRTMSGRAITQRTISRLGGEE